MKLSVRVEEWDERISKRRRRGFRRRMETIAEKLGLELLAGEETEKVTALYFSDEGAPMFGGE